MHDLQRFDPATARFALYYTPPAGSPHDAFGSVWLGRDARSGATITQPVVPGLDAARLAALTASPRLYGLHATLKPPFRLREGASPEDIDTRLRAVVPALTPFSFRVVAAPLDGFLAWQPRDRRDAIAVVAETCVTRLDELRAPPSEAELARRRAARLSDRQETLLARWGYPYVLDQFRFHISLSERVSAAEADLLLSALAAQTEGLEREPLRFDAISLFVQPDAGEDFRHVARYGFDGKVEAIG
ncbi:DUF1045 domain-containing protein [Niveibacterium sp. SC-1]|uniref:DUF1045 domain-containing protein n=1 Tax=Niveibacterium sp. SC-1 TaxID=3135646 RepID=UPI00311F80FD